MKVLLIGINFGKYELKIKNKMEEQGHEVLYMYDSSPKFTINKRLFGQKVAKKFNNIYTRKKYKGIPNDLDIVIVIVGRQLTREFLLKVKQKNKNARFVLYLWDDVKRVENFKDTKDIYDEIYSFDLVDCKRYNFKHLPLFYSEIGINSNNKKYDIYAAMFNHSDRVKIIKETLEQCKKIGMKCKFIVCLGRYDYIKNLIFNKKIFDMGISYVASPIKEEDNYENMRESKTILDVQFSSQIGLTMRTIESLGMGNKLITSNNSVKYYDFYDERNILIIDRLNPQINKNFMQSEYIPVLPNIYEKYKLDTWVKVLLGIIELPNYIGENKIEDIDL